MKRHHRLGSRQYYVLRGSVVFILLFAALVGGWIWVTRHQVEPGVVSEDVGTSQLPASTPVEVSSRTLSFGDVFWARYIDDYARTQSNRFGFPFSGLSTLDRQNYDAWIADMECPVVTTYIPSAEQDANLSFACLNDYVPEAAKWFTVMTIANNHTDNQGAEGLASTRKYLGDSGIQYFGDPDPEQYKDLCEIVVLPARMKYADGTYKVSKMPIAMCGMHHVFKLPTDEALAVISEYSKYLPVWVYGHMGTEYSTEPSEIQRATYRSFIDAGADLVIGDHVHRVQPAEAYKGKLIVYSVGNMIFDQQGASFQGGWEVWRGVGIGVTATIPSTQVLDMWQQADCHEYHDACMQWAKGNKLARLNATYTYSVVTTDNSNHGAAKKASDEWQLDSLERLDWGNVMAQLGQNARSN